MPQYARDRKSKLPERGRCIAINLPDPLIDRLRLDAVRKGVTQREIVVAALDHYIPKNLRCVSDEEPDSGKRTR
jgi:hypothetical protein